MSRPDFFPRVRFQNFTLFFSQVLNKPVPQGALLSPQGCIWCVEGEELRGGGGKSSEASRSLFLARTKTRNQYNRLGFQHPLSTIV